MGPLNWVLLVLFVAAVAFLSSKGGGFTPPLMPSVKVLEAIRPTAKEATPVAPEASADPALSAEPPVQEPNPETATKESSGAPSSPENSEHN